MHLHFLGTGDAFGSGGRFNTCFLVERGGNNLLIDCGASSMIAMRRFGVDPNSIGVILVTHLHGDHFGGLPFFVLDAQLVSRRPRPLTIVGPKGTVARAEALMEASFPGSSKVERRFAIETIEIDVRERTSMPEVDAFVTGFPVRHPSGARRSRCGSSAIVALSPIPATRNGPTNSSMQGMPRTCSSPRRTRSSVRFRSTSIS